MHSTHRFAVAVKGELKNFLKIRETPRCDLIISPRGRRDVAEVGSARARSRSVDTKDATVSSITVHPNLRSKISSVTVNYKDSRGSEETRTIAGILGVKDRFRLFPVLTSIGRNIGVDRLTMTTFSHDESVERLWPNAELDLGKDSLAFTLAIASPDARFVVPNDFPRNVITLQFTHFQVVFFYWLFNCPTRFRGTTLTISTPRDYADGFEFHELLNFTNDATLLHMRVYEDLPPFEC